jgi:NAD(P)-dependent dehydrogenase (short-subunit alcohol dehydrogenase family)
MTVKGNAIVIGYGPGVGAAVASAFGREGHALSLIARDQVKLDAAVTDLSAAGLTAKGFAADAGDEGSLTSALGLAQSAFGDASVLVYNAAYWRPGPTLELTADMLVHDFRVSVAGALTAAQIVAPAMKAKREGSILFTGGGLALYPSPEAPSLSIGKAGIRSLALMLAKELADTGVRVGTVTIAGTVAPGTSLSPERVAEAFLTLHHGAPDPATAEVVLKA